MKQQMEDILNSSHSTLSDTFCDPMHPAFNHRFPMLSGQSIALLFSLSVLHRSQKVYCLKMEDVKTYALKITNSRQWKKTYLQPLIDGGFVIDNGDNTISSVNFCVAHDKSYLQPALKQARSQATRHARRRPQWLGPLNPTPTETKHKADKATPADKADQAPPPLEMAVGDVFQARQNFAEFNKPRQIPKSTTPQEMPTGEPELAKGKFYTPAERDARLENIYKRYMTETEKEKKVRLAGQKTLNELTLAEQQAEDLKSVSRHSDGTFCFRKTHIKQAYLSDATGDIYFKGSPTQCSQCVPVLQNAVESVTV